jgi:fermentation-respiration switch protein FrsA (DUF1100 family)
MMPFPVWASLLRIAILLAVATLLAYLMRVRLLNALLYFPTRELDETPASGGLRYEDLAFRTDDGETLHGWWVPAPHGRALGHVLFFHGNAGNISHRVVDAQLLAAEGFDVLLFDYRGYGRSTGRPDEDGTYRDARAAHGALRSRPTVEPSRIFYLGESLGGGVALALALEAPPAGIVLRSAFTGIKAMGRLHYPLVPGFVVPDAYPSLRRISALRCPLLVLHGERDDLVPIAEGQALFAAAPEPKSLVVLPGAGHNDLLAVAGPRQARAVAEWARAIIAGHFRQGEAR